MKPSAPILSPFAWCSDEVWTPEVKITKMSLRSLPSLICLHASMPEISGSTTSSRTTSGRWARAFSRLSFPVDASRTSCPALLRAMAVRMRSSGSFSVTSILILLPIVSPLLSNYKTEPGRCQPFLQRPHYSSPFCRVRCTNSLAFCWVQSGYMGYTFFRVHGLQHSTISGRVGTRSMTSLIFKISSKNLPISKSQKYTLYIPFSISSNPIYSSARVLLI